MHTRLWLSTLRFSRAHVLLSHGIRIKRLRVLSFLAETPPASPHLYIFFIFLFVHIPSCFFAFHYQLLFLFTQALIALSFPLAITHFSFENTYICILYIPIYTTPILVLHPKIPFHFRHCFLYFHIFIFEGNFVQMNKYRLLFY